MITKGKRKVQKKNAWSFVRLNLTGKHLDPQKVSRTLGISADICGKLGDPIAPNSDRRCKQGYWDIESGRSNWRLEAQIKDILKRIAPVKGRLRRLIKNDATMQEAYLTIVFEPAARRPAVGCYLPSDLIGQFTSLGVDVNLVIHLPGG
jgi:hypothetical protein